MSATEADISLSLRNKQYLPPPIQELPLKDDYYNTQKQQQQQQQHHEDKFEENKYGNSKYQVFEVHNRYEPSTGNAKKSHKSEEIRIQHINAPADFPLDDPNLDASYLSLATGSDNRDQQIVVKHENKNGQSSSNNIPVPFPSNYHHTFPEKSNKNSVLDSLQKSY